jgi:hypothetical protein
VATPDRSPICQLEGDDGFAEDAFVAGFLVTGFLAGEAVEAAVCDLAADGFAAGFLAAGFVGCDFAEDPVFLLYILVPTTAAAAVAITAPATAADLPGLPLIAVPADEAALLAESTAFLAVSDADLAADFALPVNVSASSRILALAFSKVPVGCSCFGMILVLLMIVDRRKSLRVAFVPARDYRNGGSLNARSLRLCRLLPASRSSSHV